MAYPPSSDSDLSDDAMLWRFRDAIRVCLVRGQSYTILGTTYTSHDLDKLRKGELHYEAKLNAALNGIPVLLARRVSG